MKIVLGAAGAVMTGALAPAAELFPLSAVKLGDGPFRHARDLNEGYVLAHDPDRLLAPFLIEAGLEPLADPYPNWESSGLGGHSAGHFLTAYAQMVATTGNVQASKHLDHMVAELARCQAAIGTGYVGGVAGAVTLWDEISAGELVVEPFSLNGRWVPWYNLHKTYAGLRDAWVLLDHAGARDVLLRLGEWTLGFLDSIDDATIQEMLRCEHGGMNEILADLAALTGDDRYLRAAERFSHLAILEPLLESRDALTGLHANTQIPKVIGFARVAELEEKADWNAASRFFWDTVVAHRSVVIGGNSVREHFHALDDFQPMIETRQGPETCNTHNMLRLSEQLFRMQPSAELADYYERSLYNHILGSRHPEHGGFVYFTPMRPRHYRVYSQPETCFWCCVGSGIENHGKYGRFIYAREGNDTLYVNLFLASTLSWQEAAVSVRQETDFPFAESTRLRVSMQDPEKTITLKLRRPEWLEGEAVVTVDGEAREVVVGADGYLTLPEVGDGAIVEMALPLTPRLERFPDGSPYAAFLAGPIALAAVSSAEDLEGLVAGDGRMAHVADGPLRPLETAPFLRVSESEAVAGLAPVEGAPLHFTLKSDALGNAPEGFELRPFFQLHDARYILYWPLETADAPTTSAERAQRAELEARTLDRVGPGEQQPEVEHRYAASGGAVVLAEGRRGRQATDWFAYTFTLDGEVAATLFLEYANAPGVAFRVLVNGEELVAITPSQDSKPGLRSAEWPLPAKIVKSGQPLEIRFEGLGEASAGPVYDVRLLRPD